MVLFALVTVLFFLWGMSNNLTDILVQQFKKSFELSTFSAQPVDRANCTHAKSQAREDSPQFPPHYRM